jgi:hypothetical protein
MDVRFEADCELKSDFCFCQFRTLQQVELRTGTALFQINSRRRRQSPSMAPRTKDVHSCRWCALRRRSRPAALPLIANSKRTLRDVPLRPWGELSGTAISGANCLLWGCNRAWLPVELIVQPDAHDVVGELAADRDGAESWIADLQPQAGVTGRD